MLRWAFGWQGYIRVFLAKRAAKYLREHRARLLAPEASVVDELLATRRDSGPTSALTLFNFTALALGATKRRPSPDKLTGPRAAKITLPTGHTTIPPLTHAIIIQLP
jgi:hypothetical protein